MLQPSPPPHPTPPSLSPSPSPLQSPRFQLITHTNTHHPVNVVDFRRYKKVHEFLEKKNGLFC